MDDLRRAIKHGDVIAVRRYLEAGGVVRMPAGHSRGSPLWMAASEGNAAIIRILLDAGADVEERYPLGTPSPGAWPDYYTPLVSAAMSGSLPAVELLLARGAKTEVDGVPVPDLLHRLGHGYKAKIIIAIELARLNSGLTSA